MINCKIVLEFDESPEYRYLITGKDELICVTDQDLSNGEWVDHKSISFHIREIDEIIKSLHYAKFLIEPDEETYD